MVLTHSQACCSKLSGAKCLTSFTTKDPHTVSVQTAVQKYEPAGVCGQKWL